MKNKLIWLMLVLLIIAIMVFNLRLYINILEKDPRDRFKVCHYLISSFCVHEGPCNMEWAALPFRNPKFCRTDKECIDLAPAYKSWTIEEVKCKVRGEK